MRVGTIVAPESINKSGMVVVMSQHFSTTIGSPKWRFPKRPKNVTEFQDPWDLSANKLEVIIYTGGNHI